MKKSPAFKIPANCNFSCAYLYSNGIAIVLLEKYNNLTGKYDEFVHLYENFKQEHSNFPGRIIIHRYSDGLLSLFNNRFTIYKESLDHGSENTKNLNIPVGYVKFTTKTGGFTFSFMEKIISGGISYQNNHKEMFNFDDLVTIGQVYDKKIVKIFAATE